ncbi:MAG: glycosyltransferase, partial [Spirochaetaceae bacterium]|nr:glycosyltransferase [Spirochaetaceae bacterium]
DAPYYFRAADLFVIPANYEPFGLVGIEAMSSGTAILATALGGFLDYLKDGKNGLFIKRDALDIAQKIKYLMDNREELEKMSHMARETALDYSWEKIGKQYLELIEEVYSEKR